MTTDDITDEMVARAQHKITRRGPLIPAETIRLALVAALTEPPRPEGAEEIEEVLWNESAYDEMTVLDAEDRRLISNYLASRGVRVVTKEER